VIYDIKKLWSIYQRIQLNYSRLRAGTDTLRESSLQSCLSRHFTVTKVNRHSLESDKSTYAFFVFFAGMLRLKLMLMLWIVLVPFVVPFLPLAALGHFILIDRLIDELSQA
jgi:hypothetical protein